MGDEIVKKLAAVLGGGEDSDSGASEGLEEYMQDELKEPEHAGSAASGDLEQFAKEEEAEPEHKQSLGEDKDLLEWASEEEGMEHLGINDDGVVTICNKPLGKPEDVIAYIQKLSDGGADKGGNVVEDVSQQLKLIPSQKDEPMPVKTSDGRDQEEPDVHGKVTVVKIKGIPEQG